MVRSVQSGTDGPTDSGIGARSEHLRILSRADWVEPIVLFLKNKAVQSGVCNEAAGARLVVAMTEAITNAIVHGNYELSSALKQNGGSAFQQALQQRQADPDYASRIVDIRVEYQPDRCVWTITDQGQGFDVEQAVKRLECNDPTQLLAYGRGITIMRAFVDEVTWSAGGRQIHLAIHLDQSVEKRRQRRRRYTAAIVVELADGSARHTAVARDLSTGGIAFIMDQPLAIGVPVIVTLDADQPNAQSIPGRTVRCHGISSPYYDLAVKFESPVKLPA